MAPQGGGGGHKLQQCCDFGDMFTSCLTSTLFVMLPSGQRKADVTNKPPTTQQQLSRPPPQKKNRRPAVTLTLRPLSDCLVTSVTQRQEGGLGALRCDVYQREEKHGPDDLRREGHLQDDQAQLDVLTTCLHGDGPAASAERPLVYRSRSSVLPGPKRGLPRAEPACDRHEVPQREACQRHQRRHQQDVGHQDHPEHAPDGHGGEDGHHHAEDDQEAEARLGTGFRQLPCEADKHGTPSQLTFFTTGEYFGA